MVGRAFSVKVDFDLHAVTCPGVWLCPNGKVAVQIHMFDSCTSTHRITPIFPLLYHSTFKFQKVFTATTTLAELERKLSAEYIIAELIQWSPTACKNVSLATFQTNLIELLYPVPCFKGLLAGVDIDLLMEPSKDFPGILSPKIEVSTKTTIEEVTDFDIHPTEVRVINPKLVNSMNQRCIHKRNDPSPVRKIIRQKKVCHSDRSKLNNYICRNCRRKLNNVEVARNCCSYGKCSLSSKDDCYLSSQQMKQICNCSLTPRRTRENCCMCNDAHILDSCPICLKYKCYFSKKNIDSNASSKLDDVTNFSKSCNRYLDSKTKLVCDDTVHENCTNNVFKLSDRINSISLQNEARRNNCKLIYNDDSCKCSFLDKHKAASMCRSSSVPSLRDDPTTSILLAKKRQLERTKERLNYANCVNRDIDHNSSCDYIHDNEVKKGFYKNLQKFYKKMYKHAKNREYNNNGR